MDALKTLFSEMRAVRDCEGVRALVLDLFEMAAERGEAEALAVGRVVLAGVRNYVAHEAEVAGRKSARLGNACPPGAVLGTAALPTSGEWWGLLEDGRPVPADDRRAEESLYWCRPGDAGWFRVEGVKEGTSE